MVEMKKKDMINLIGSCINTTRIVRTYFRYDVIIGSDI